MAYEFKLPDIGEGVAEGEIVKWLVKVGDTVQEDQPLVEIMTDKATVEIPSPKSGKIESLLAKEGDVILVGKVFVKIAEGGESKTAQPTPKADTPLFSASPSPERSAPRAATSTPHSHSPIFAGGGTSRVLASPATRKMARELGLDLSRLQGSGPEGRVIKSDLTAGGMGAIRAGAPLAAAYDRPSTSSAPAKTTEFGRRKPTQPTTGEERIALRGIRKKTAEHMALSKRTAAHYTHVDEVDMTELVALRNAFLASGRSQIKLTYIPFIVKALCIALREFPAVNATLDEEKGEIVLKHYYNLGIAVATNNDELVVPVIKNADQKSVLQLAVDIQAMGDKARTGRLGLEDVQGGTFTLTSMGNLGGLLATPIINYPQVAILGFHRITDRPVVRDGQIVVRKIANISLSLDHRVVDGAIAASFTNLLTRHLEQPGLLMLDA